MKIQYRVTVDGENFADSAINHHGEFGMSRNMAERHADWLAKEHPGVRFVVWSLETKAVVYRTAIYA